MRETEALPFFDLTIAMPAYLEAENLAQVLPEVHAVLRARGLSYEILVLDTREPKDKTPDVCRAADAVYTPRAGGDDYGDAVRTGIARSRGRRVIFMDADGSHPPAFIGKLLDAAEGIDLVIASRYVRGGSTDNPFVLVLLSWILNITYRLYFGLAVKDVSNSFRLYDGDLLRRLSLECAHFDIVEEILLKLHALKPGLRVLEIPFRFEKRMHGKTKRNLLVFVRHYLQTMRRLKRIQRQARRSGDAKR